MNSEELIKQLVGGDEKKDLDLVQLLRTLWRKKKLLLIPLALAWLISAVGLQYVPLTYRAVSSVVIEDPSSFTRDFSRLFGEQGGPRRDTSGLVRVKAQIKEQAFLNDVITDLGMDRTAGLRARAEELVSGQLAGEDVEGVTRRLVAEEIRKLVDVHAGGPDIYYFRVDGPTPADALLLNDVITRKFVEERRSKELAEVMAKGDFSDQQEALHRQKLSRAEKDLARAKEKIQAAQGLGNPVNQDNVAMANEVTQFYRQEQLKLENRIAGSEQRVMDIFGAIPSHERLLSDDHLRALENQQISSMLSNIYRYLGSGGGAGLSLSEIVEGSVGRTRQDYRARLADIITDIYTDMPYAHQGIVVEYYFRLMEANAVRAIVGDLELKTATFRGDINEFPALEREVTRLEAEVRRQREMLQTFQLQSTSADLTLDMQEKGLTSRVEIMERAVKPLRPIKPNKLKFQLIFIFFGLGTGVALALITHMMNRSFTDVPSIEKALGVPVLGTIPSMSQAPGQAEMQRHRNTAAWVLATVVYVVLLSGMIYSLKGMHTHIGLNIEPAAIEEVSP